jgi:hypothetical protein
LFALACDTLINDIVIYIMFEIHPFQTNQLIFIIAYIYLLNAMKK